MKNIILITIDCLRPDHLGCFSYHKNITPTIDELAKNGSLFLNTFSNGPYTAMSFPSILTSTYPLMHPLFKEDNLCLSKQKTSIAEVFQKNNYVTAAFHSNPCLSSYFGYNKGFDVFKDLPRTEKISLIKNAKQKFKQKHATNSKLYRLIENLYSIIHNKKSRLEMYLGINSPYENAQIINDVALKWVLKAKKNFFLWIHLMDTHAPYFLPLSSLTRISAAYLSTKAYFEGKASSRNLKKLIYFYDQEIKYVDNQLKFFFEELKEKGIWIDNSYIIITSDHGEEFMEHGGVGHGPLIVKPKLYDELLHVPLIIAGPNIEYKKICNINSLLDLSPTITELSGMEKKPNFLGHSLVQQMNSQIDVRNVIISEYQHKKKRGYSYRTRRWKYILTFNEGIKRELYNLKDDPYEQENLYDPQDIKGKEIEKIIKNHITLEKRTKLAN